MWKNSSNNHGISDPSGFRRDIGGFAPKFLGFDQHDSQEFLSYALDGIHTELNRVLTKSSDDKKVCLFVYNLAWLQCYQIFYLDG